MGKAKQAQPGIRLMLDKERTLILTLGSLRRVEEKIGESLFTAINWQQLGMRDLSLLLWGGLLRDDPDLTQDQSDDLFTLDALQRNLSQVQQLVQSMMSEAFPEARSSDTHAEKKTKQK